MQTCLPTHRVPRAELDQAAGVSRSYEQDVALLDLHSLRALRGLEISPEHMLAGPEPRYVPQPRYVQQRPAADETVPDQLDRLHPGALGGDRVGGDAVVQAAFVGNVTQRVDMRVTV